MKRADVAKALIHTAIVGNTAAAKPFQPAIGNQPNFKPIQYCNKAAKTNEGIEIPNTASTERNVSVFVLRRTAAAAPNPVPAIKPKTNACSPSCADGPRRCATKVDTSWFANWNETPKSKCNASHR